MFSKTVASIFYLFAAFALLANAAVVENEKRQIDSVFNSLTSDAGSIFSQGTSVAGSIASDVTSIAAGVATTVISAGGHAVTVITSAGGQAITLATDGAGKLTSFAGSQYSIATADAASIATGGSGTAGASGTATNNAALGVHAIELSAPLVGGLLTALASIFMGAWVAL
ncbi:hypothetical protein K466DRAFT_603195 [Polyporus arcularius HHB13444]|uniref:Uncharacterized protein n=1 Tax=Polyporus arcularius HHB13444 TaxID=1314778 RepID=A0A5C3P0M7_9APHY|nr:hypothetical protein K466DRAFT_603195 [Polyporus arcularius HHB13444]